MAAFKALLAIVLVTFASCGKDKGTNSTAPPVGILNGEWAGCMGPTSLISATVDHGSQASSFSGTVQFPSGSRTIAGGVLAGEQVQFTAGRVQFNGTLQAQGTLISGTWIDSDPEGILIFVGEFRIAKQGSGPARCTRVPEQLTADLRLVGSLGVNTSLPYVIYSGQIKNYGLATARNPGVSVKSYNAAGQLIGTSAAPFLPYTLRSNEATTFEIYSNVRSADLDSSATDITWDRP